MYIDPSYAPRLFQIEGGSDPNVRATGSNRGMGQFGPNEERAYGITDQNRTDPTAQTNAVLQEANAKAPALAQALGRDPTHGELYLAHQQGQAGAIAHLTNPDQPAWQSLRPFYKSDERAKDAVWRNIPDTASSTGDFHKGMYPGGVGDVTSREFSQRWINKFERGMKSNMAAPMNMAMMPMPNSLPPQQSPQVDPNAPPQQQPQAPMTAAMSPEGLGALYRNGTLRDGLERGGDTAEHMAAWLGFANNPAASAAMLKALDDSATHGKYTVTTDAYGRQRVFDIRRGRFVDAPEAAPTAGPKGADQQVADATTAKSREAAAIDLGKSSEAEMKALNERMQASAASRSKAEEALRYVDDPNVHQGLGGNLIAQVKAAVLSAGLFAPKGAEQTGVLAKNFAQLTNDTLNAQHGVRFAGPEIKQGQLASPDLEKLPAVNKQVLQDIIRRDDVYREHYNIALRHMRDNHVLGTAYDAEVAEHYRTHPMSMPDAVQPTNAYAGPTGPAAPALPKGVKSIQIVQ